MNIKSQILPNETIGTLLLFSLMSLTNTKFISFKTIIKNDGSVFVQTSEIGLQRIRL